MIPYLGVGEKEFIK